MSTFQKWLLWLSSALTGITGVVYWWMDSMLEPINGWAVINHPLQPLVLKTHIVVAPVLVFAVGLIATDHIWKHLRTSVRDGRRSGVTTLAVLGPMVVSGYAIQVFTHALLLTLFVWVHLITGTLYLVGLGAHLLVLWRRRVIIAQEERRAVEVRPGTEEQYVESV